jgi:hypothetical protein
VEALQALVRSAGDDSNSRAKVEAFVMRSLAGASLVPTGIAGYAALARLNPQGAADEPLSPSSPSASSAARPLAQMLTATDDPQREELLCRTLVRVRSPHREVPIARVLQRVQNAPDRSAAAHCMLLCLHPKSFAQAAVIVQQRWRTASEALQKALAQTYKTLTGAEMSGDAIAGKA